MSTWEESTSQVIPLCKASANLLSCESLAMDMRQSTLKLDCSVSTWLRAATKKALVWEQERLRTSPPQQMGYPSPGLRNEACT